MAGETLRTASQLLAEFPDNTAGLIDAINSRNAVVSEAVGIGFLEDDTASFVIDVTAGVVVSINAEITPLPQLAANFAWDIDGNNAWIPDYGNNGIITPAGVTRLVGINTTMILNKLTGGSADYIFQYRQAGVLIGNAITWNLTGGNPQLFTMSEELLYEPALGENLEITVTGSGTSDDLDCLDFRQRVTSVLL